MTTQEKMQSFTDAGRYEQDQYIDFEPEGHIYTYRRQETGDRRQESGVRRQESGDRSQESGGMSQESGDGSLIRLLPVSSLIAYFFEQFDAQAAAQRQWERYHIPVEESLRKWERIGKKASEVGTFLHEQTESYFKDGTFETDYAFEFAGEVEHICIEKEKQHFLHFIANYQIHPYRQEWPVFDRELNIAGTIDMVCKEVDGEFTIYDWKRSTKVVNAQGQPIVDAFFGRTGINGISLPDTPFYHYCIQQNLYRYMLESHYGIRVKAMNLVVLCPDYPTYFVASVPRMDEVIQQIKSVCHERDLGHRLLVDSSDL